jgi:hypothetical protein
MFKDYNPNYLCDEVFTFKNFLSKEELAEIIAELELIDWDNCEPKGEFTYRNVKSLFKYEDRLKNLISGEELSFKNFNMAIRRPVLKGMFPHVDVINYLNRFLEIEVDENFEGPKQKYGIGKYSFIIYLNDNYSGGEICYPEYGIEYKPEAGEIVIHSCKAVHAVKKVTEGYRFTHSNIFDGFMYVDAEKLKTVKEIDLGRLDKSDPLFYFSSHHGKTENKRFAKFLETYVEESVY